MLSYRKIHAPQPRPVRERTPLTGSPNPSPRSEFDQFVKHTLKATRYIRYADDFVLLSENRNWLVEKVPVIHNFLEERLRLTLHPKKLSLKTLASGVDFLGLVHFPDDRVLRTSTKKRMMRRTKESPVLQAYNWYLGLLRYGNANKVQRKLAQQYLLSGGSLRD